ncbi:MAG: hypothetical protein IJX99_08240 [Clostridia bacterium]|nr:hypothetical protein [Clostridia bacterium]
MEFKITRDEEYIVGLKSVLSEKYGLEIAGIEEGERGAEGETWLVNLANLEKVFVKIGYMKRHIERLKKSVECMDYMESKGVQNINKALKTTDAKSYIEFNDGVLVVFEYIDGEIDFNIPYTRVMENLLKVYKIGDNDIIQREDFNVALLVEELNKAIETANDKDDELKEVLEKHATEIKDDINKFVSLKDKIDENTNKYITHGDCCVNVMQASEGDFIIDWDEALMAPIERDCWFFMNFESKIDDINNILQENGIDYKLSDAMLLFYAYKSFVIYLTDDIYKYIELKDKDILSDIEDLFSGWVRLRIDAARI